MITWRDTAYFVALSLVDGVSACLIAWAWLKLRQRRWQVLAVITALLLIIGGNWLLKQGLGKS